MRQKLKNFALSLTIYHHLPHHPFTKQKALSNSKLISSLTILEYLLTKYFLWHVSSKRYDMQIFKKNHIDDNKFSDENNFGSQ